MLAGFIPQAVSMYRQDINSSAGSSNFFIGFTLH